MSRQLEEVAEQRTLKRREGIVRAVEFDLVGSVAHAGGVLTGFSIRFGDVDTLMTVRAVVAGRPQIAWVGGEDLGQCLTKCCALARSDRLNWREDKFAKSD